MMNSEDNNTYSSSQTYIYIYIELYRDTYDDVFEKMTIWLWNVFLVVPLPEVPARRGDLNRWCNGEGCETLVTAPVKRWKFIEFL